MGNLMKALCLTLLFFAYSFGLLGTGMLLEKRIMDVKEAEKVQAQEEIKAENTMTTEEYHKYYEIVVSRIITSEFEGLDKEAIKTYIKGYDERFKQIADLFYPKRETDPEFYGTNFHIMYSGLKKAFDENELNMYKGIILNTSSAVSNEDIDIIFKNPAEQENTQTVAAPQGTTEPSGQPEAEVKEEAAPGESAVEAAAKRALEGVKTEENVETREPVAENRVERRPEPSYY